MGKTKEWGFRNRLMPLIIFSLVCFCFETFSMDSLKWYTEDYPPFNFKKGKGSAPEGIAIELLEATHNELYTQGKIKRRVLRKDYKLIPWVRAYRKGLKKRGKTAFFSTTRTEERELKFKWFGPIAKNINVLFALKDHQILTKSEVRKALSSGKVTGIKGDAGLSFIRKLGVPKKNIRAVYSPDQMFKLLKKRKVQFMAYGKLTTFYLMKKFKVDLDDFKAVYTLAESELWFAVNRNVTDKTVEAYQEALESVKKNNGALKEKLLSDFNLDIQEIEFKNSLFGKKKCPHKSVKCNIW